MKGGSYGTTLRLSFTGLVPNSTMYMLQYFHSTSDMVPTKVSFTSCADLINCLTNYRCERSWDVARSALSTVSCLSSASDSRIRVVLRYFHNSIIPIKLNPAICELKAFIIPLHYFVMNTSFFMPRGLRDLLFMACLQGHGNARHGANLGRSWIALPFIDNWHVEKSCDSHHRLGSSICVVSVVLCCAVAVHPLSTAEAQAGQPSPDCREQH